MNSEDERNRWLASLTRKKAESDKSWWTTLTLSFFFGWFGFDRFYLNQPLLGIVKLVTVGMGGIWWFLDLVLLALNQMRDADGALVRRPF